MQNSYKIKNTLSISSSNPLSPQAATLKKWNLCLHKNLYSCIAAKFSQQKMFIATNWKQPKCPSVLNEWMEKQALVHRDNEILLKSKKKELLNTHNLDGA